MAGTDYFELLGLPRQADLEEAQVQEHYHKRIAECHPDRAGTPEEREAFSKQSGELNQASATLKNPVTRVRHLLDLMSPDLARNVSLNEALMALFSKTGQAIQEADAYLNQKRAATSALAKALLAEREIEVQESLQEALGAVTQAQAGLDLSVTEVEDLRNLYAHLSFLDKWQRQLNERLLLLLVDD